MMDRKKRQRKGLTNKQRQRNKEELEAETGNAGLAFTCGLCTTLLNSYDEALAHFMKHYDEQGGFGFEYGALQITAEGEPSQAVTLQFEEYSITFYNVVRTSEDELESSEIIWFEYLFVEPHDLGWNLLPKDDDLAIYTNIAQKYGVGYVNNKEKIIRLWERHDEYFHDSYRTAIRFAEEKHKEGKDRKWAVFNLAKKGKLVYVAGGLE